MPGRVTGFTPDCFAEAPWTMSGKKLPPPPRLRMNRCLRCLFILPAVLLLFSAAIASAAVCYVSPDGSAAGDGSKDRPFPVDAALAKGGGNEYIFLPGLYRGPIDIGPKLAGTPGRPTVLKSETRWKARISGSPTHNVNIEEKTPFVTIDGFEISGAGVSGIKSYSDGTTVRNCWIHNNSMQGMEIHGRQNATVENNIVEFNGMNPQYHHGIYMDGGGHVIRGNVIRHNAGFGLHLYPKTSDTIVVNNLIYGHSSLAGAILSCAADPGSISFVNNTVADNASGLFLYGCRNVVIQNDIFAGNKSLFLFKDSKDLLIDFNLYGGPSQTYGPHDVLGAPRFAAPYRGVYLIDEKSPAVGRGNPGVSPPVDMTGADRPKDAAPDIGAFQHRTIRESEFREFQYRTGGAPESENFIFWTPPGN